jgi:hypothetical protein
MRRSAAHFLAPALAILCLASCGAGGSTTPVDANPRPFAMGFTDFPGGNNLTAVLEAWSVIRRDGDLAVLHFDDGVPWQEALDGAPYAQGFLDALRLKADQTPVDHRVYLALTPISIARDGLALHRGNGGNEPLETPWDTSSFGTPQVIAAYAAHCSTMVARFQPDYFAYAIEANLLYLNAPESWGGFVDLAAAVYASIKADHPSLPVFLTLQADAHLDHPGHYQAALAAILPYTDYIAMSGYPYSWLGPDPLLLRADYFSGMAAIAPGKPFAVAETGWPAETVDAPYPITIPASPAMQRLYVQRLLADCETLNARFVCWFFTRDYDSFWQSDLQFDPDAPLLRLWRDTGLYDGDGQARPALADWRAVLARPRAGP